MKRKSSKNTLEQFTTVKNIRNSLQNLSKLRVKIRKLYYISWCFVTRSEEDIMTLVKRRRCFKKDPEPKDNILIEHWKKRMGKL